MLDPTIIRNPMELALTIIFFQDLCNGLESLGLAFNVCVVKIQNLINKVKFCLKIRFITLKSRNLNNKQRYASFGSESSEKNARTTNAHAYYRYRLTNWAQFHRAAKQPIFCLLYVFHFIALLTVKHRERHANLLAVIASKWVMQHYKFMVNAHATLDFLANL